MVVEPLNQADAVCQSSAMGSILGQQSSRVVGGRFRGEEKGEEKAKKRGQAQ